MKRSAVVRLGACAVFALAAACGPPGKKTTSGKALDPDDVVRREPFSVVTTELIFAIARDATHLYWADLAGVHRRPLGGPDAGGSKLLTDATGSWGDVAAMVVIGDRLYLSDGVSVAAVAVTGGDVEPVLTEVGVGLAQPIVGLAATSAGDLIVATYDAIVRVPKGGTPVPLATGQIRVTSIAVDADHVYWTEYAEDPGMVPAATPYYYGGGDPGLYLDGPGLVRRVPLRGGPIVDLATAQRGPSGVSVSGGRVWWASDRGPGVQSAPVAGGAARVEVAGRADRLARDDAGMVVRNLSGLISEWSGGPTGEVRMTADGRWLAAGKPIVLTPEWIYVMAMHPYEPRHAVIALPRQDEAVDVVAAVADSVLRVRARDGVVWWVESMRGTGGLSISQRDPRTGEARRIAGHSGYITEVAAGRGELYFSEDASIYRVSAGGSLTRFATANSSAVALTVHRNHVFWLDGNQVMAKKRKEGQPFPIAQTSSYGSSEVGSDMVFDDDFVYLTSYGGNGTVIFRVSERGEVVSVWDAVNSGVYPLRDLVMVNDELFFAASLSSSGEPMVYRLGRDGDGTLLHKLGSADRYIFEMTAGGGFLYVALVVNDVIEVVRVDATSGEARTVLRWQGYPNEPGFLTADETGAYLGIEAYDAVIRIAHDAPALPAPIQFGPM